MKLKGGNINIISTEGKGTVVWFTLKKGIREQEIIAENKTRMLMPEISYNTLSENDLQLLKQLIIELRSTGLHEVFVHIENT